MTFQRQVLRPPRRIARAIVIATVALVGAGTVSRMVWPERDTSLSDLEQIRIRNLARHWVRDTKLEEPHPCPPRSHLTVDDTLDYWGKPIRFLCDTEVRPIDRVLVISAGPDGVFHTPDDVSSR